MSFYPLFATGRLTFWLRAGSALDIPGRADRAPGSAIE